MQPTSQTTFFKRRNFSKYENRNKNQGSTLLEVLVAMLLLTFVMLYLANVVLHATSASHNNTRQIQAQYLLNDLISLLSSNDDAINNYAHQLTSAASLSSSVAAAGSLVDCNISHCEPDIVAKYQLANWQQQLHQLPNGASKLNVTSNKATASLYWSELGQIEKYAECPSKTNNYYCLSLDYEY
ncbi:type IV pilus modification protein PilV [Thalassotalea sp. Y01]|uniref:type IV pilus modification protein PilV n=1 Tax=Thalassotalea sp. Y01 TaxID=2729613 RepID=UPI00249F3CC4|nr:type IV pilus modification protein PilV [Thalassotalea sp. Y01]